MAREVIKQLRKDYFKLERDPPPGISAAPSDGNFLEWQALICGPEDTPFEGGCFKLKMIFPSDYPSSPPRVWFYSKMFHPNVYPSGKICLDILEEPSKWSSDYDAAAVLCGIQAMLGDPNPGSPANGVANDYFINNKKLYERKVEEIVNMSLCDEDGGENQNQLESADALALDLAYAMSLDREQN